MTEPSSTTVTEAEAPTTAAAYPDIAPTNSKKTVYLIRHAHSLENQRISSMFSCFGDLGRFTMPKKSDVTESLELLKLEHDAPLSDLGLKQCRLMKDVLNPNNNNNPPEEEDDNTTTTTTTSSSFVHKNKIELVVHSPLERARQTCQELIGYSSTTSIDPPIQNGKNNIISQSFKMSSTTTTAATTNKSTTSTCPTTEEKQQQQQSAAVSEDQETYSPRVVSLNLLEEKHQLEWVPGNTAGFEKRVIGFQKWLSEQPESIVVVVGHSQYFKKMLELPYKFDNTDVYKVSFDPQRKSSGGTGTGAAQQQGQEPITIKLQDGTIHEGIRLKPEWFDLELLHPCCCQSGDD